ncbi:hypothetical protein Tco_1085059, partial [Tanacetum coccineum]
MATMAENVIVITVKDTDGVTEICRPQRLEDLAREDKLRYDNDIKAVNILLLGLPVDIYTLINHYQTAKEIWDRVKELMEGESIHSYYLRFTKFINDMRMIPMTMSPMQINTKFVNHLQLEWSRFVTTAKQAKDLHSVNFDQLYAFLKHNEKDAKEVREMRQRFPEPLALLANTYNLPPSYNSHQTYYAPTFVQQPPTFQPDTGLAILTFLPTDDPIASLNKAMIFLSSVYRSNFLPQITNFKLRLIQELKLQFKTAKLQFRMFKVILLTSVLQRKRVKDSEWFKDKMLLAQAQEVGVVFNAEQQDFLADNCDDEVAANAIFMENLSPVGSINDDMVEPRYDSDIHSEVPYYDTYHDYDMLNSNIQELGYIENIVSNNESYDELKGDIDVISYTDYMLTIGNDKDNYVPPPVKKNDMMLSVIEQMKSQVEKCNMVNKESKRVNESLTSELKQYKEIIKLLEYAVKDGHLEQEAYLSRELYSGIDDSNKK